MSRSRARWAIAFLIGLATVTATGLGWRAAQIGSTAAFDDRQSIGETLRVERQNVERTITVAADAREYARYRADYAVAAALDREAGASASPAARAARDRAAALREGATRRAATAGVFGPFTITDDLLTPRRVPRPFDAGARARALAAEQTTSLDSPGVLDPDGWARSANDIRVRVNHLVRWAFVVLVAVLLYTLAEVSTRTRRVVAFAGAGLLVYLVGLIAGLSAVLS